MTYSCVHDIISTRKQRGDSPKELKMNKFEEAEALAEELDCNYELAYDFVYGISGDPEETDDAL